MAEARPQLILGSASPRRRDLLDVVGLRYEVLKPETPEIPQPGEAPAAYVARNAREKADWVAERLRPRLLATPSGFLIISADTVVVLGQDILEKPRDINHATEMLQRLSGRSHTVFTGVTLQRVGTSPKTVGFVAQTDVRIKPLNDREIAAYIRTGEPLDKAGGYAAQGIGSYMVESINGSYANVVGLPVAQVIEAMARDFAYELWT